MEDQVVRVALKEWAIVTELLAAGEVALVLRKGGVHEDGGPGRFRLEHDRFALYPAYEHERLDWIKPRWRPAQVEMAAASVPSSVEFLGVAQTALVVPIPSREAFAALDDLHAWTQEQIDMRFNYRPEQATYAVLLRVWRLPAPVRRPNRGAWAGCRSWIPLEGDDGVSALGAQPAIDQGRFAAITARVRDALRP
jgi:hypothetical protein